MIMSVLSVNKNNFDSVKNSEKPVLLDFYGIEIVFIYTKY